MVYFGMTSITTEGAVATSTISAKGWVVIPSELRKKHRLQPGDKVHIREEDGRIVLVPALKDPIRELHGIFSGGPSMLEELLAERRREIEQDEREHRDWLKRRSKSSRNG